MESLELRELTSELQRVMDVPWSIPVSDENPASSASLEFHF